MPDVLSNIDDLLAGVEGLEPLAGVPGVSGASLRRGSRDGQRYVVKLVDWRDDWTQHASGVLGGPVVPLWQRGVLDRLPDCINQPIVGVAMEGGWGDWRTAVLMRDIGEWLIPATDEPIPMRTHRLQLTHLARMHATFWQPGAELDVVPEMHRFLELSPWMVQAEAAIGSNNVITPLVDRGWRLLPQVAPRAAAVVTDLALDPGPLVQALADTPATFIHGDWKLDNLGLDDRDRTVLFDWELPGVGAPLGDVAFYLAINCRRLPQSKEAALEDYRSALEAAGIDTEPWWEHQLALCLLGALVQFGWEKALGGYDEELAWWERKAVDGAEHLTG